jgi:hypothetical protein
VALGYETTADDDVYMISSAYTIVPKTQAGASYEPPPDSVATRAHRIPGTKAQRAPPQISRLVHRLDAQGKRQAVKWTGILEAKFKGYGDHAAAIFERVAKERGLKAADPEWEAAGQMTADSMGGLDLAYEPEYLSIARQTFELISTILSLGVNLDAPAEQRIIARGGIRKGLVDIEQQTKDAIFAAIEQGRAGGEGAAGIADLIREMVPAGPWGSAATRAMVIARSETKYAQNISSLEAYRGSENITGVEVFDAQLGPTDEECMQRNGRVVTFDVGELMVQNEHPNGTISLAPYMGELPADAGEEAGSGWFSITHGARQPALAGGNGNGRKQ